MMGQALETWKFVRRTQLGPGEYRRNFRQLDVDTIAAVTSREADLVTPLMSKIYLRLVNAPARYWEREGVLRFEGELRDEAHVKAWEGLCKVLGVASATASKALRWMHEQGIIGYFAGKNGAGIRVFINRAASSIGTRKAGKKILEFPRASSQGDSASSDEAAFNDSFAVTEVLEKDLIPRAPKNGAETRPVGNMLSASPWPPPPVTRTPHQLEERERPTRQTVTDAIPVEEIVERLRGELERRVKEIAVVAAAQSVSREIERTRQWFETKALPKAVRVAQHETYGLLRKHGAVNSRHELGGAGLVVGRRAGEENNAVAARLLTEEEVRETAEVCVALLETQGKSIEVTLAEISSEGGGWLLPEDAPRVREAARELAPSWCKGSKV
jgi:hypothetical protein